VPVPLAGPADRARRAGRGAATAPVELHQRHQGDAGALRTHDFPLIMGMTTGHAGVSSANSHDQEVLVADHTIEYTYTRSTGPVIGAFMTALRERQIVGVRAADGRVLVPPAEYDPVTSEDLSEIVPVANRSSLVT